MNKIKQLNDYKITSGGYIFDQLDRGAHAFLRQMYSEIPYWLTSTAKIAFLRQLEADAPIYIRFALKKMSTPGKVQVIATMIDPNSSQIVATATFTFAAKTHLANNKGV